MDDDNNNNNNNNIRSLKATVNGLTFYKGMTLEGM
jgi:hypothetical protein